MRDALRLYLAYVSVSIRSQMQYRASFLMFAVGSFFLTFIDFVGLWALFDRFGSLQGWSLPEVALFYGIVHVAFALAEAIARGFDVFSEQVQSGGFDRLLLRPRSTAFQVGAQEVQLFRIGRMAQGALVLAWAATELGTRWTLAKALLCLASIAGGACLFAGLFVLQATLSFWTTTTLEIVNTVTYGGVETASYPLSIYRPWFRRFFTFVVPLACINYYPAHAILGRPAPGGVPEELLWLAPLLGFGFLLISLQAWEVGVRHYRSTGS